MPELLSLYVKPVLPVTLTLIFPLSLQVTASSGVVVIAIVFPAHGSVGVGLLSFLLHAYNSTQTDKITDILVEIVVLLSIALILVCYVNDTEFAMVALV